MNDTQKEAQARSVIAGLDLPAILVKPKEYIPMITSNAEWVKVTRAQTSGLAWRVIGIRHLPPEENGGRHNVFVSATVDGNEVRNGSVSIAYGWEGQDLSEKVAQIPLNKTPPDLSDIPIFPNQKLWITLIDAGNFPSDRVSNLHGDLPDSNGDIHHHSYIISYSFMRGDVDKSEENDPITPDLSAEKSKVDDLYYSMTLLFNKHHMLEKRVEELENSNNNSRVLT